MGGNPLFEIFSLFSFLNKKKKMKKYWVAFNYYNLTKCIVQLSFGEVCNEEDLANTLVRLLDAVPKTYKAKEESSFKHFV